MEAMSRRAFVASATASAAGSLFLGSAQASAAVATDVPWAGERIVDCHFHARSTAEAMIAHLDGAGVSHGLVLATDNYAATMRDLRRRYPGRFAGWSRGSNLRADGAPVEDTLGSSLGKEFAATSVIDALSALRLAVRAGAHGFAETVGRVAVDGPELQRLYAMAGEMNVPVMMHFQTSVIPGQPVYGITGYSRIEAMLKKYPRTRFVCHASDFWGNIDASFTDGGAYPTGNVNRGGLTDRLLADYANMHGDFGAPSGLMQLARDPEFTSDLLHRHQDKLLFGSDCGCADGRGGYAAPPPAAAGAAPSSPSAMQVTMAARGGLANKCIARELLKIAWNSTPRDVFRKLAWGNAARVYRLSA